MKIILLTLFSLLFFSCGESKTSELNYATFTPGRATMKEWSAFTTIERRGCVLPVELYSFLGNPVSAEQSAFVRASVERSVTAWTSALRNNPFWKCPGARVQWGEAGPGTIQIYLDPSISRGYALVGQNQIYLASQSTVPSDPFAERVILHEMGHMFGLADTYTEPGYQQPISQPIGIMNNLYSVPGLTPDDLRGALALYDYINGRGEFCAPGYQVGGAFENPNRIAFCVPG